MLAIWKQLPPAVRRIVGVAVKGVLTVGVFYLLLTHPVESAGGGKVPIWRALSDHMAALELADVLPYLLAATCLKMVGIFASMLRWHLLLIGQGIRFNFWHIVGAFLTGRFLGTFLPGTWGLDGYKLYDAARFSERVAEPAAATAVEKVMGMSGVFLCFLVTLPFGYPVFGSAAPLVAAVTVPIAAAVVIGLFLVLFRPGLMERLAGLLPAMGKGRVVHFIERLGTAAAAYRGKGGLLAVVSGLSFVVHFNTAIMYFFTAVAVGAVAAPFWEVSLASTVQIFATVVSPFTIAGEGVRELVQQLLLAKRIGISQSILSASLGFFAAEALTLVGVVFLWSRGPRYRPRRLEVTQVAAHMESAEQKGSEAAAQPA